MPVISSAAASRISLKNSLLKQQNRTAETKACAQNHSYLCSDIRNFACLQNKEIREAEVESKQFSASRCLQGMDMSIWWYIYDMDMSIYDKYEQNAHFHGSLNFHLKHGYRDLRMILLPGLIFYVCMYRHTCCNSNYLGLFFSFLLITQLFTAGSILSWLQYPLPRKLWCFLVQHIDIGLTWGRKWNN